MTADDTAAWGGRASTSAGTAPPPGSVLDGGRFLAGSRYGSVSPSPS